MTAAHQYPRPASVKGAVLADLLTGRAITHKTCWIEHGSSRLAHHVLMLRRAGWPIATRDVDVPTSDGRRAEIGEYSLEAQAIDEAGEAGRSYIDAVRKARQSCREVR